MEKLSRLGEIAEADSIYRVWKNSRQSYIAAFEAYADSQPEDIRNMLWGYAEGGRMMLQRKVLLACKHMDFKDEKE